MSVAATYHLPIRVYYEDTDFSGVVYHASYLRFMERGRTEMLREMGIHQADLHQADRHQAGAPAAAFVVRHMTIDWIKPARMDDLLMIETAVELCGGASMILAQTIRRDERVLVTARVQIAYVSAGRPIRLPDTLRAKFAEA